MVRIQLRFARSDMHLAEAAAGDDGEVVAGVGTRLSPSAIASLRRSGVRAVWVREGDRVAPWELDKDPAEAVADLEARFATVASDPILAELEAALRAHILQRAAPKGRP
jgi:hypothetical protein